MAGASDRPITPALGPRPGGGGLRGRWRAYRLYRQTRDALRALSPREREDIGLAGEDPDAVARAAVYGR